MLPDLKGVIEKILSESNSTMSNNIIISFCNYGFVDFVLNLVHCFQRLEINNYLIFSLDIQSYLLLFYFRILQTIINQYYLLYFIFNILIIIYIIINNINDFKFIYLLIELFLTGKTWRTTKTQHSHLLLPKRWCSLHRGFIKFWRSGIQSNLQWKTLFSFGSYEIGF